MEKIISLILLLLITLSSFLSLALCRPINDDPAAAAEKSNHLDISPTAACGEVSAGIEQSSPRWWFHGGIIPRLPWHLVRPQFKPWRHWEFVSPPRIAGGFKWPHWRFVIPAHTWPRWGFVQRPLPPPAVGDGSHWPPTTDSTHWLFVQPPMPSGDYTIPPPPDATTPPPPGAV